MRIAIIDNYDSFTWNLYHYFETLAEEVKVFRYDAADLKNLSSYDRIVISPGPGLPSDYPKLREIILHFRKTKPILGICLGHQAIAEAFGGRLINLPEVWHGITKETIISVSEETVFKNIPQRFTTGHYHSWVVDLAYLPDCFRIICRDNENTIMGLSHKEYPIKSLQFHPESILTSDGKKILENWLS